jgi:hypothetical protein
MFIGLPLVVLSEAELAASACVPAAASVQARARESRIRVRRRVVFILVKTA